MNVRSILVTGANRGIGLEVSRQLASAGWRVFMGARAIDRGVAAVGRVSGDVTPVELDVADPAAPDRAFREIGPVDALVNNAGVHYDSHQTAVRADWRIIEEAFAVNFFGA